MVTNETLTEMLQGKRPAFIFTCEGRIQHWQNEHGTGVIIATSREAARVVAECLTNEKGKRVSISEVGTVQGETLDGQIKFAFDKHGATGVFITEDGEILHFF